MLRVVTSCGKSDLKVVLGDLDAVSSTDRLPGYTVLGPWGSGSLYENSEFLMSFCRGDHLSIAGSWFQRKDIHLFSWASNDGHTQKEIDHVLLSRGNTAHQCKVYHSLDVDSDHFPVITTVKLKVKRVRPHQNTRFIPDLSALSKPAVRKLCTATDNASAQEQSVENLVD